MSEEAVFSSDTKNENYEVVIIGAGVAGLSAALHLAERGLKPLLFEAHPQYSGGRLAGGEIVEVDGWEFRGEHGVHGIWSPYRNLQAMLARHGLRPVLVPAQEETWYHLHHGQVRKAEVGSIIRYSWFPAPLHYLALFLHPRFLGMLGIRDWLSLPLVWYGLLLGIAIDPLIEDQPMEGMWLGDLVKGWSPAIRAFFMGLVRNGFTASPDEIPLAGFLAFLRFYTLLRRDSWAFSYLPGDGGTTLVEPLAAKVKELGTDLQMGIRVKRIEKDTSSWRIIWENTKGKISQTLTKQVVFAADSPNIAKLVANSPDLNSVSPDFHWPKGFPTVVVRVWFNRKPNPGAEAGIFTGDFIVDNFFWLHRLQKQYIDWQRATGGSAIEVHIYGPPELLDEPDAAILTRAVTDIQTAYPELRGHRVHQIIQRNDATHTLFSLGSAENHLGIRTPWQHIYCCGDWVRHPTAAFFLERACLTGIEAASAVLEDRGLEPCPLLPCPPPEPFAGWLERVMIRGRRVLRKRNQLLNKMSSKTPGKPKNGQ